MPWSSCRTSSFHWPLKRGQNARLAARLTGFKIDIKSETQARESGDFDFYEQEYENGYEEVQEIEQKSRRTIIIQIMTTMMRRIPQKNRGNIWQQHGRSPCANAWAAEK